MIQQIETYKLMPHPGNPRKSMGDLTELSNSIKENGVLQNLTVVPMATVGVYRVVIGHRRLQAAVLAELESVPCIVVEMDEKTQLSTMLLENMTRSDLTPYEQAQGIQQCLDIGMTETEISKKTGFSKSTVKRRLKILELDENRVKDAQGSIEDYIALEEIEDVETRNNLLKYIGTNNFLMEIKRAVSDQNDKKSQLNQIKIIESFANEFVLEEGMDLYSRPEGYTYHTHYYSDDEVVVPDDYEQIEYIYKVSGQRSIYIYKQSQNQDENVETEEQRINREQRESRDKVNKEIQNLFNIALESRLTFAENILNDKKSDIPKATLAVIYSELILILSGDHWRIDIDTDIFHRLTGIEIEDENQDAEKSIGKYFTKHSSNGILTLFLSIFESDGSDYFNYRNEFDAEVDELGSVYKVLELFGYKKSDVEISLLDGTHPLYVSAED